MYVITTSRREPQSESTIHRSHCNIQTESAPSFCLYEDPRCVSAVADTLSWQICLVTLNDLCRITRVAYTSAARI